jgi:hypothetical protein
MKQLIGMIRKTTDKKVKSELKSKLFYFTPSIKIPIGSRRKYSNIESWTGVMQLDFDGEDKAEELKEYLWENFPYLYTVYISPSGKGVKALMRIPIVDSVISYKELFLAVEKYFHDLGVDSFDHAPYNPILPLYLSHDKDIKVNWDPEVWTDTMALADIKTFHNLSTEIPDRPPSFDDETVYKSIPYFRRITMDIFERKVDEIVSEPGHHRWRDACLVLGSRVSGGYITLSDAEDIMKRKLFTNSYLAKGIKGYLRTGYWALDQGQKNPKFYE